MSKPGTTERIAASLTPERWEAFGKNCRLLGENFQRIAEAVESRDFDRIVEAFKCSGMGAESVLRDIATIAQAVDVDPRELGETFSRTLAFDVTSAS